MYSILKRVEQYVRDFGMPYKKVLISSSYFPENFNRVVLEELNKELQLGKREDYIKEYILSLEEDDELKLLTYASNNKTRLIISPEDRNFNYQLAGKKISEYAIIEEIQRREKQAVNDLVCIAKAKGLGSRINIDLMSLDIELRQSAKLCIAYIDYLNKYYQEMLKSNNEKEKLMIKFTEPESSTVIRRTRIGDKGTPERVNSILSVDERIRALEAYDYLYSGYGYSKSSKEIEYINYLYDIGDNRYALIMEPYNGTKATKVQIICSTDTIDMKCFDELVKTTLSLPFSAICKRNDIMRFYHLTMESFENNLASIIIGKSKTCDKQFDYKIRKRINEACLNR